MTTTVTTLTRRLELRIDELPTGGWGTTRMPRFDALFAALAAIHDLLPRYTPRDVVEVEGSGEASSSEAWKHLWETRRPDVDEGIQRFVRVDWMVVRLTYASPLEVILQAGGASGLLYFVHRFLTTIRDFKADRRYKLALTREAEARADLVGRLTQRIAQELPNVSAGEAYYMLSGDGMPLRVSDREQQRTLWAKYPEHLEKIATAVENFPESTEIRVAE